MFATATTTIHNKQFCIIKHACLDLFRVFAAVGNAVYRSTILISECYLHRRLNSKRNIYSPASLRRARTPMACFACHTYSRSKIRQFSKRLDRHNELKVYKHLDQIASRNPNLACKCGLWTPHESVLRKQWKAHVLSKLQSYFNGCMRIM